MLPSPLMQRLPWLLAALLPVLPSSSPSPETSFYNTVAALLAWGGALLVRGRMLVTPVEVGSLWAGMAGCLLYGVLLFAGEGTRVLALGVACIALGWAVGRHSDLRSQAMDGLSCGYALAALTGLLLCSLQFFAPDWTGNAWVAASQVAGRAVGNLRQPNLQATMMIWGAIAAAWLAGQHAWASRAFPFLLSGAVFTVAMTGSRTGMVLTGLLALWGALDGCQPRPVRRWLMAAPLLLLTSLAALWAWAHLAGGSYFVETRVHSSSDISSSRFAIWSNTLELIRAEPWTGVGWGNFNFAWTLTAFDKRPVAFFDHTHNLLLQLAVELGIPATLAIGLLFAAWLWRFRGALVRPEPGLAATARTALAMLGAVLFHSLLEYPLWYAYFLLPSAFLLGLYAGLGTPVRIRAKEVPGSDSAHERGASPPGRGASALGWFLIAAGAMTLLGTLYAVWDYQRITQIFAPYGAAGARPLAERIRDGQQSHLFGAHADYAAVTMAARPSEVFESFERPLHRLIDARLMIAYARALAEHGERDKAVYVAQRLREFRHPLGDEFFAVCKTQPPAGTARPSFQCETTPVQLSYRDFQSPGS